MHSMEFTHPNMPKMEGIDFRLLFTNSHNGTSSFRGYIKALVQVCTNGLVAWRDEEYARVIHRGYALTKVGDAIDSLRAKYDSTLNTVAALQARDVTPENTVLFLTEAAALRDAQPFRLSELQRVRHAPQAENTAWNVFNRVQESLIRGGYTTKAQAEYDMPRLGIVKGQDTAGRMAKEITSIKDRVKVNTQLWQLAVKTLLGEK
jgi:hypothetical protein